MPSHLPKLNCQCPTHCKYCGARRRRDPVGHYCPTKNCDWQHGYHGCKPVVRVDMEAAK